MLVQLTPSGRQTAATVRQAITGLERRALGTLPAEAVAGLHAALQALTEAAP